MAHPLFNDAVIFRFWILPQAHIIIEMRIKGKIPPVRDNISNLERATAIAGMAPPVAPSNRIKISILLWVLARVEGFE